MVVYIDIFNNEMSTVSRIWEIRLKISLVSLNGRVIDIYFNAFVTNLYLIEMKWNRERLLQIGS